MEWTKVLRRSIILTIPLMLIKVYIISISFAI